MADDLDELLIAAGLSRVADVIEREAHPSILLTATGVDDEATIPLGATKLGGSPDLPPAYSWPGYNGFPLSFIAQINLAKVAAYDVERRLPSAGMLYFFYSYDYHRTLMLPESPDMWRVLYYVGNLTFLARTPMPSPLPKYSGPFKPCLLTPSTVTTLAPYDSSPSAAGRMYDRFAPVAPFTEAEIGAYGEVAKQFAAPDWGRHRMLGYGDGVQYNMPLPNQVLLLQIDSDDDAGIMWGDVGTIYYMISPHDLECRDFRNIHLDEQCC